MPCRPQVAGTGKRSMIASAVDTRHTRFFVRARRRNTELRLPAISRDGSKPSKGSVFSLGNTRTSSDGSRAHRMLPSRSALSSFSERNTRPLRSAFLHCWRRWSASMPSGEADEIVERDGLLLFFIAPTMAQIFRREFQPEQVV